MASSRVMTSASSARADLVRHQSPLYPAGHLAELNGDRRAGSLGSMNMEELLRNFYADNPPAAADGEIAQPYAGAAGGEEITAGGGGGGVGEAVALPRTAGRTVEEIWKEISQDRKVEDAAEQVYNEGGYEEITLEAFLERAGAVTDDDIRAPPMAAKPQAEGPVMGFVVDPATGDRYAQQQQQQQLLQVDVLLSGSGNGVDVGAGGRGRKRPVEDPGDKAAQQKQRRMIKNRESAARSRERKQAYILELEASITRLEEENARLVREQEEQEKARLKQLMENLIPVVEMRKPTRCLRRTCSA